MIAGGGEKGEVGTNTGRLLLLLVLIKGDGDTGDGEDDDDDSHDTAVDTSNPTTDRSGQQCSRNNQWWWRCQGAQQL